MAETVVSMATSLVGSAISKAASAAANEISLLIGVQKHIWYIRDELKAMQAFLRAAEVMKKKDELLKVWAEQIRDLSYNIEDCLDEFKVHVESQSMLRRLMKLRERHRIAIRIRDLKSRVEEVSNRNTRYNLIKPISSRTEDERDSAMEDIRNQSASNVGEDELVGFADSKKKLLELLDVDSNDGPVKVICVVGMGGLGKTALSRKIYESKDDISNHFSSYAWVTISQLFDRIELLKSMIMQLLGPDSSDQILQGLQGKVEVQVHHLAKHVMEELKEKRYIIFLDDLWTLDAWNWINSIVFPKKNDKGSRIVVTTRDVGLAEKCTAAQLVYHLDRLRMEDAIILLLRKTNISHEDIERDQKMKKIVDLVVKKCGHLPLAILTIGALLATKEVSKWEKFCSQLPSELETNPNLEALRRVVTLSYNHLPSHLKQCFLYLSIFPEDSEIQMKRLVDRWIAEGFVKGRVGMTIKDVGESYFNELMNRSMIQPSKLSIEGKVKSCRVHDVIRDITISISREENFVCLVEDNNVTSVTEEDFRHVAYHGSKCPRRLDIDWSHVRSLTVSGETSMKSVPSLCSVDLKMLRVLDLAGAQITITQKDINNIGLLRHLKYVNISWYNGYRNIYKLPSSIGKLEGLQTLNIGCTYIATLPTEISKLRSLRSLRCEKKGYFPYYGGPDDPIGCLTIFSLPLIFDPDDRAERIAELHMAWSSCWSRSSGVRVPRGISNLKELQILEIVDIKRTSCRAIKELGELTQLRKLSVATFGSKDQKYKILCAAIEKLSSLCYLAVDGSAFVGRLEWVYSISSPPPLLRSLTLRGRLGEMPDWVGTLTHLVKIRLCGSLLKESKSLEILGALPNLMLLHLYHQVYVGEKLVFTAGAFPNLRKLNIYVLDQVKEVRFEEGTSPLMERIQVSWCRLESGIMGIKHLPRLKEISLDYYGRVAKLAVLEGEVDAHPNHPVLRLLRDRSHHDLDGVERSNDVQVEATEETSVPEPAAGESSQVVMSTANVSQDHGLWDVQGSNVEDDGDYFYSCISDDKDAC